MTSQLGYRNPQSTSATIKGWDLEVKAEVGSVIELDSGRCEKLLAGDDYTCPGWDGCDFRYPNPIRDWAEKHAIACNIHVTGRTLRSRHGGSWVRVKIEWVQDCEPNTHSGGWLKVF